VGADRGDDNEKAASRLRLLLARSTIAGRRHRASIAAEKTCRNVERGFLVAAVRAEADPPANLPLMALLTLAV